MEIIYVEGAAAYERHTVAYSSPFVKPVSVAAESYEEGHEAGKAHHGHYEVPFEGVFVAAAVEEDKGEEPDYHRSLEVLVVDGVPGERFKTSGEDAHHEVGPIVECVPALQGYDPAGELEAVGKVVEYKWGYKGDSQEDVKGDVGAGLLYQEGYG